MPPAEAHSEQSGVEYEGVLPLGVAFERALSLLGWDCASAAEPTGGPLRDAAAARAALAAAQRAVDALGLFSSNEDVEDLATPSMRYLLLPFLAAELENSRDTAREPAARMAQLRRAKEQYEAFLARAEQYSFAPQGALERGGRDGCSDHGLDIQRPLDPGAARAAKIARFKRSRELAGALAALRARRHTAISVRGGDDGGAGGSGGDDGPGWDEDDDRTLWGATLESCVLTTLDALPLLQQELALLEHAAANGGSCSGSGGDAVAQTDGRVQHRSGGAAAVRERDTAATAAIMSQLSDIAGQLRLGGRPTRDELRQQVFRPSHILPTMTIEQQGAIELADARRREAAAAEAAAAEAAARADARSDDEDEEELERARAWDEFKDHNPRGWGNSKLRPCA